MINLSQIFQNVSGSPEAIDSIVLVVIAILTLVLLFFVHTRKVVRLTGNQILFAGVCGGLARHFNIEAGTVRGVTFLLMLFAPPLVFTYLILLVNMDKTKDD